MATSPAWSSPTELPRSTRFGEDLLKVGVAFPPQRAADLWTHTAPAEGSATQGIMASMSKSRGPRGGVGSKRIESVRRSNSFDEASAPDVARQFRNGEDISKVVEKLQHIALDGVNQPQNETGPGDIPNWDYVHPRAVYSEYLASPYHNSKLCT